jgi:hypothetical protein
MSTRGRRCCGTARVLPSPGCGLLSTHRHSGSSPADLDFTAELGVQGSQVLAMQVLHQPIQRDSRFATRLDVDVQQR